MYHSRRIVPLFVLLAFSPFFSASASTPQTPKTNAALQKYQELSEKSGATMSAVYGKANQSCGACKSIVAQMEREDDKIGMDFAKRSEAMVSRIDYSNMNNVDTAMAENQNWYNNQLTAFINKYQGILKSSRSGSLCGSCGSPHSALEALTIDFGDRDKAQAALNSLNNAVKIVERAMAAFERRELDPAYRIEFDKMVEKWIGKATPENIAMLKERVESVYNALLTKAEKPEQYLKNPENYPNDNVQMHAKDKTKAFCDVNDPDKQIFLNALFFDPKESPPIDQASTIIHEESHLSGGTHDEVAWGKDKWYDREAVYFLSEDKAKTDAAAFEYFILDIPNPKK